MIDFGRDLCSDLPAATRREWLVTNGIGGFAMGTLAGTLTRRYHGLLVAALDPPLGRTLLLAKVDDTFLGDGQQCDMFTNHWAGGTVEPMGVNFLENFRLEGTTPVWTFACGDILLEKRIWMEPGANITYLRYDQVRGNRALVLNLKTLVNYRGFHSVTRAGDWQMNIEPVTNGLRVTAFEGAVPFYLLSRQADPVPRHTWFRNFHLSLEEYRGLEAVDDHLHAATFKVILQPGESVTLAAGTEESPNLDGHAAYAARRAEEERWLAPVLKPDGAEPSPELRQLALAAGQFVVRRPLPDEPGSSESDGHSVIAGYPWFSDWGRDTMIALPGLTLATGHPDITRSILRTYARFVDRGMLPNRFPAAGETPEYNTADASLWYFEAIRAYHAATGDDDLLAELFPVLETMIDWHRRGTRYNIHVDPLDGLLYAGEEGVQLTWMDAKVGDWVVTPRIGKPVEINALWYNALRVMADLAPRAGREAAPFTAAAGQVRHSFGRFWNTGAHYCFDVLDGPEGHEDALRPNQLLAVALPHSPLESSQQRAVVDICARRLLTSHGLRTLEPEHPAYAGRYGGSPRRRDGAYHQGTVWAWLLGPFVRAHLRVYRNRAQAESYLRPLLRHLRGGVVGSISEIFDGDPPHAGRGCPAQAWSVAQLLETMGQLTMSNEQ